MDPRLSPLLLVAITAVGSVTLQVPRTVAAAAIDHGDDTPWSVPEMPPKCSRAQADSGDVAGCVLVANVDPDEHGWGLPPAPGVGPGWRFSGSYSGSPALTGWEAEFIASNAVAVGPVGPGRLHTHVAVSALFEGFIAEISSRGYRVGDAHGYEFRCTEGSGGWNCPSGDRDDLSNHAWGIAVDMNAGTNPIRTYSRTGSATACATPMATDMPRWVIQTAERWGLYWGGYGWSGGCASGATERDRVYRDPPHFEFRGSVAQALAIATHNGVVQRPMYCTDVVTRRGRDVTMCNRLGRPGAGWRTPVPVAAPAGAAAVVTNLTASGATGGGYLTVEGCGAITEGDRPTSNTNFDVGRDAANLAIVSLEGAKRLCVYRSAPTHSIVDVVGFVADDRPGRDVSWFGAATPTRLGDTRSAGACSTSGECTQGRVPARGIHSIELDGPAAPIVNLTVADATAAGFVAAGDCGSLAGPIGHSNVNYQAGAAVANLSVVDTEGEQMCVYTDASAHVIVDQLGVLHPDDGDGWKLITPVRALDTRGCVGSACGQRVAAGGVIKVTVPAGAEGAVVNLTVTGTTSAGYATVAPCEAFVSGGEPATSTVNHAAGANVSNMAFVEVDENREICVYTFAAAHLIVDVQALLVARHDLGMVTVTPTRAHDSRV